MAEVCLNSRNLTRKQDPSPLYLQLTKKVSAREKTHIMQVMWRYLKSCPKKMKMMTVKLLVPAEQWKCGGKKGSLKGRKEWFRRTENVKKEVTPEIIFFGISIFIYCTIFKSFITYLEVRDRVRRKVQLEVHSKVDQKVQGRARSKVQ